MWRKVKDPETCKANLEAKIKEQALRCFLISNKQAFTTISLQNLEEKFQLSASAVQTTVNKMIYDEDLVGSITEEGFVRLYHQQVNRSERMISAVYEQARKLV